MKITFKHRAIGNLPETLMSKFGVLKADNSPEGQKDRRYILDVIPGQEHKAQEAANHLHNNGVIELDLILVECGGCGCFHPKGFAGDCRDDDNRFPTDNPADKYEAQLQEWDVCIKVGNSVRVIGVLRAHSEKSALKWGKRWYGNNVPDAEDIFVSPVTYDTIQIARRVRRNSVGMETLVS